MRRERDRSRKARILDALVRVKITRMTRALQPTDARDHFESTTFALHRSRGAVIWDFKCRRIQSAMRIHRRYDVFSRTEHRAILLSARPNTARYFLLARPIACDTRIYSTTQRRVDRGVNRNCTPTRGLSRPPGRGKIRVKVVLSGWKSNRPAPT